MFINLLNALRCHSFKKFIKTFKIPIFSSTNHSQFSEAEAELSALKKSGHAIDKELHALDKKILQQEQAIQRKAHLRHSFLHECKVNGVQLPLLKGTMDRLVVVDESLGELIFKVSGIYNVEFQKNADSENIWLFNFNKDNLKAYSWMP